MPQSLNSFDHNCQTKSALGLTQDCKCAIGKNSWRQFHISLAMIFQASIHSGLSTSPPSLSCMVQDSKLSICVTSTQILIFFVNRGNGTCRLINLPTTLQKLRINFDQRAEWEEREGKCLLHPLRTFCVEGTGGAHPESASARPQRSPHAAPPTAAWERNTTN